MRAWGGVTQSQPQLSASAARTTVCVWVPFWSFTPKNAAHIAVQVITKKRSARRMPFLPESFAYSSNERGNAPAIPPARLARENLSSGARRNKHDLWHQGALARSGHSASRQGWMNGDHAMAQAASTAALGNMKFRSGSVPSLFQDAGHRCEYAGAGGRDGRRRDEDDTDPLRMRPTRCGNVFHPAVRHTGYQFGQRVQIYAVISGLGAVILNVNRVHGPENPSRRRVFRPGAGAALCHGSKVPRGGGIGSR